ncbi:hypothetical protein HAHE_09270 [Haloferula helveola]|uniref:Uncharacterized protein n=1 Tax=Haloferula helveola TaxID=490095 RepID=A0ABN6H3N5_9BACT|nr:hypothetical protein HAHE_09270 [Haloferula helveola]
MGHRLTTALTGGFALACALGFSACDRATDAQADAEWWRLEGDRHEKSSQVELLKQRLERKQSDGLDAEAIAAGWAAVDGKAEALEARIVELEAANESLVEMIRSQREQWLAQRRDGQRGREIEELASRSGRTYRDVTINRVTEAGIEFSHATGLARMTAADLTPEQRDDFGIDFQRSTELVAREDARQQAYRQWVDGQLLARAEQEQKDKRAAELAAASVRYRPTFVSAASASTLDTTRRISPLDQPARSVGRSSFYNVYYSQPYRTRYYTPANPLSRAKYLNTTSRNVTNRVFQNRPRVISRSPNPPRRPSLPRPCPND